MSTSVCRSTAPQSAGQVDSISRLLVSLAAGLLILALSPDPVRAQGNRSTGNVDIQVSKPTTLAQVLENIRYAVDRNLLLARELYLDDRPTLLFGGTSVLWVPPDKSGRIEGYIAGLKTIVDPILVHGIPVDALSIDFSWTSMSQQKRAVTLHLRASASTNVRFDEVVRIFGLNWKTAPPEAPNPHRQYDVVTRPHGNARILYDLSVGRATYGLRMEFHGDASLYILDLTAEEEI